jgi:SAM-dependent methyltransferase
MSAIEMPFSYVGNELDVFQHAINWKHYWGAKIQAYMGKRVLEVGAGIGGTTRVLCNDQFDYWLGLEPDPVMAEDLRGQKARGALPSCCDFQSGTVENLDAEVRFDTILYIDVLEHIEQDAAELARAALHLENGGYLIVLSPAFPYLYTSFDRAIGHYRRYTRRTLRAITPPACRVTRDFYLDAVGMLASLGNKWFLQKSTPSLQQILFWDRLLVPAAKLLDPLVGYSFGRSVVCVWQRS